MQALLKQKLRLIPNWWIREATTCWLAGWSDTNVSIEVRQDGEIVFRAGFSFDSDPNS
jgi:hypothetical protein